ncbi:MAG: hypothetical protein ACLQVD_17235 [Capsulimonadaceae bacterium]
MDEIPVDAKSQEYINFESGLRRALAVPKAELDRREKAWREQQHKCGRPKAKNKDEQNG